MVILGWSVIDELNSDSACKRTSQHVKYRNVHETGSNVHQKVLSTQVWPLSDVHDVLWAPVLDKLMSLSLTTVNLMKYISALL